MQGPNFTALAEMRAATRLPVIASGGVSSLAQARELAEAGTYAAIVGRALYEGAMKLPELLALAAHTRLAAALTKQQDGADRSPPAEQSP